MSHHSSNERFGEFRWFKITYTRALRLSSYSNPTCKACSWLEATLSQQMACNPTPSERTTTRLELTPPLSSKSEPLRLRGLIFWNILENSQSQGFNLLIFSDPLFDDSPFKNAKNLIFSGASRPNRPQILGASRPGFYFLKILINDWVRGFNDGGE